MKRVAVISALALFLALGALVALMLINPWLLTRPSDDMYGRSIARVYNGVGGEGKCRKGDGNWWRCPIEIDPGSGFGLVLLMWKEGRNCWTAYEYGRRKPKRPVDPGDRELPPNTYLRGKPLAGCVSLREDLHLLKI